MLENPARSKEVTSRSCNNPEPTGPREDRRPRRQTAIRGELIRRLGHV